MFIAHLPAGYLLTTWIQKRLGTTRFLWVGLVASVLPDLDLLYFYFIDGRQTLHHHYWTHVPLFWVVVGACFMALALARDGQLTVLTSKRPRHSALAITTVFFANIFLHLILDTFVGGIAWLYPFSDHDFFFVTVPATHAFWILSFIFHWTFLIELAICVVALCLIVKRRWHNDKPMQG